MIHPICTAKNGVEVYIDLVNSEAAPSIAKQPQVLNLVKEVLAVTRLTSEEVVMEHDMGRLVGYDSIIDVANDAPVFYACIQRDEIHTRFIKGGKPAPTNYMTMTLRRNSDNAGYELCTVRVGRLAPPRPGMPGETAASRQFWDTHAVVQDGQSLQPRTITKDRPY